MTSAQLFALCGVLLFGWGLGGVIWSRHLVRKVIALNVLSASVFLILVALARRAPSGPPDPVPHAMVLTGIVVSLSASALALALVRKLCRATGKVELPD